MPSARLRSLLDMLMNYAEAFTLLCADIEKLRAQIVIVAHETNAAVLGPDLPQFVPFTQTIEKLLRTCQQVPDLDRMNGPIGRMLASLDRGVDARTFHHEVDSLQLQLMDELRRLKLYLVPANAVWLYENEIPFGQEVFDKFPSAIPDTRNAGRCLALGQPTAAMFHLMRVMEHGLSAYAAKLGIPYAPSWEAYIRQLNKEFSVDWDKKTKKWREGEAFHKKILGDIVSVKTAWRNPTIHIINDYEPDEVLRAYLAVQGFMQNLAKKVREPKRRRVVAE